MPVALPPGRLKLATRPNRTGSSPLTKTRGVVGVAAFAANAELMPVAAISFTCLPTNSSASAGSAVERPSAQRVSITRFRASAYPRISSPLRKAARKSWYASDEPLLKKPIRVGLSCPHTTSGQATGAQPSRATRSRRLVCRERSIVRGDGGRFTTPPPSRLEAPSRLSQHSCSFDHLVGAREQGGRDRQAERFCGVQVQEKLELRGLEHRQIARPVALQDAPRIHARLPGGL